MATEFRVLGPLELRRDGATVPVRAPAQRRLLGILLLAQGSVVSTDRLAEALWPEEQPRSTRHAMQMTVSRTRRLVGDGGVLEARSPGYVLEIDPAAVDAVRFERLLVEARDLVASDPARAAARAADALALWRGGAYEDFVFDAFAAEEIARLEELRLEAEEERIEAELALGRAGELVGELEALVEAEPLRERRRMQLMRALYRSGRQADALAAFGEARRMLLDELGIEPGPELRDLQHAILNQDPSLDAPEPARPRMAVSRRPVSIVVAEPSIPLDLDPEEHERLRRVAAEHVERIAAHFEAMALEAFVLAFVQEDHAARAASAAAEIAEALDGGLGVATGEALVGDRAVGGPLVETARRRAREAGPLPDLHGDADSGGRLIGRARELDRLRTARVALLTGTPGIGKSRLAHEAAVGSRSVVVRCPAFGAEPLAPLRELVTSLGAPDALDALHAADVPLVVRRVCEAAAPILVVFDDVQWADDVVRATVEHLAARAAVDLRVLAVARDDLLERHPAFLPGAERVQLDPLDAADALALAGSRAIAARAEGNPLFIEQLRAHTAETDAPLPPTLHALLAARLDRLTPTERSALQRAAVLGRDFDAAFVAARAALESLERRTLIERAVTSEAFVERYRFAHALIRDAAYESIPRSERSQLHETLADELAAAGADAEVVGFHLERAAQLRVERDRHALRLAEDAGAALGAAGLRTMKRGDTSGAIDVLRRATALRPDDALACELGVALTTVGRYAEAADVLRAAEASPDRAIAARAHLEQALAGSADAAEVLRRAEAAIPVFEAVGDARGLGRAWLLAGWVRGGGLGRYADWLDAAERSLAYYTEAGWLPSTCIGHVAAALYFGPAPVEPAVARCRELLADLPDFAGEAGVAAHLGGLVAMTGEWDEAGELLARARSLYEEVGRRPSVTLTCAPVEARTAVLRGAFEEAAAIFRASSEALTALGDSFHLATHAAELADILVSLDERDEAETWLTRAERCVQEDDLTGRIAIGIARVRLRGDDPTPVIRLAEQTDNLNVRAQAHAAAGDLARAHELYLAKGNAVAALAATAS
jgi:DNA-binding SARP family transcriptional activator